ncbi:flagellar hook-basal body protein FliE [Helicobacter cinaedi PAGU611]|uniref:Flagellar hook-basal body complex protein FliE n=2 Tax=Helicobacter cinaedi TaxID=213 RepID=A0AAI8MMN5_9HELI|nr:flagellar hook-basal body complex protein FliE [Helicobacter cinaedi]EFR46966.1 flagellar hook-basal body complex protein FliE [Helicobacter cinaedi CCUG 18818 = ATCC BAA-847]STP09324.1 flagellar hook-basal body protein [Helicobacter cinaedi]STP11175.1 flagellar hook-basal body protein [Helicobacter cinaedi]BAM12055.1 flagellar hook-basal body protein FliE [Helicobacter cinaedi PAGU611]BAM32423.1 flagellar hook-basal body protein [Helicobacter cinaedi CCUG 18818 = ATCC BAA-847]
MANQFGVITNNIQPIGNQKVENTQNRQDGLDFINTLKSSIQEVNTEQQISEKALADMASGQVKDLHQAAIAINRAENSMKVMLEVRNKAINAYKEILRTQI